MSRSSHPSAAVAGESRERHDALERDRTEPAAADPDARAGELGRAAFVALAENVRGYAIFLMEPSGKICYWGEGARIMKWWTRRQAEGSHLRLLYPDGGSEDGTAEAHLRAAAETGEYVGEGQRVRGDGSTFWAGVTLTALRDDAGTLLGFAKVTRDLTARRGADAALAIALSVHASRDRALAEASAAREERDESEERLAFAVEQVRSARDYATQVLQRNIEALTVENAAAFAAMADLNAEIERLGRASGR